MSLLPAHSYLNMRAHVFSPSLEETHGCIAAYLEGTSAKSLANVKFPCARIDACDFLQEEIFVK